ncbi:MAG: sigma-70 family RNA polymerase sigma factor [Turneriella sp.]|nr:sigma-70 family RNA polymerase sigma factor [Turneriella sp.]
MHHEALQFTKEDFDREFAKSLDMVYAIGLKLYRGDGDEAADFVQSLYLFALRRYHSFAGRSAFSTWLYRVAWNFGLVELRRRKRLATHSLPEQEVMQIEQGAEFGEAEVEALRHHLNALPDNYRIPLILFYYENMGYAEIAELTGIKEGTLKANIHRAKAILRSKLEQKR